MLAAIALDVFQFRDGSFRTEYKLSNLNQVLKYLKTISFYRVVAINQHTGAELSLYYQY